MSDVRTRTINVQALARVEGEGALYVKLKGRAVQEVRFQIFEPPRFFEALLQGRRYSDAPDITARICGICPIAYMMGASQAMEDALGLQVGGALRQLRRLIYCGEWIESHALHVGLLHAPDFLGYDDAIRMASDHRELVEDALGLKKLGNQILECIGGRAVHPVNLRVGGFYRAPLRSEIRALSPRLEWGVEAAQRLLQRCAQLEFPDYEHDYTCVSLGGRDEYPIGAGRVVSNRGLDIPLSEFLNVFSEEHVAHSNALHGRLAGSDAYLVGPIPRYNNNQHLLPPGVRKAAADAGLGTECRNPFRSILVRSLEILYACAEALRLAESYQEPEAAFLEPEINPGVGHGCTEAPRGICYHRYELDENGRILNATIVPPTSQNQRQIEQDLRGVVERHVDLDDQALQWLCEQSIRNYDPCISCATHFLKLTVDRQ